MISSLYIGSVCELYPELVIVRIARYTSMYKYNNNYNEIRRRNNDDKNK